MVAYPLYDERRSTCAPGSGEPEQEQAALREALMRRGQNIMSKGRISVLHRHGAEQYTRPIYHPLLSRLLLSTALEFPILE
jgi:hypothetical protein